MSYNLFLPRNKYFDIHLAIEKELGYSLYGREYQPQLEKHLKCQIDIISLNMVYCNYTATFESESDMIEFKLKYL